MKWPKELFDVFSIALRIEPVEGQTRHGVLQILFDEVARRVVWRTKGDPTKARPALRSPYTPLGSVIGERIHGLARQLELGGPSWGTAVDALHNYIEVNAAEVFSAFADQPREYDSMF